MYLIKAIPEYKINVVQKHKYSIWTKILLAFCYFELFALIIKLWP